MKNEGQVFTGDMIFAIVLVVAFLSMSSQAYDIASGQMQSYSTRYSLERIANDTTDILVRTSGHPTDWETHPSDLEILGLAHPNTNYKPIPNKIDFDKLSKLATEISENNWNPENENFDQKIIDFFDTKKFEISIKDNENNYWKMWPGWTPASSSGAENSLEVVSVNRIFYGRTVYIQNKAENVDKSKPASLTENLKFWIGPNELEIYDWYIYVDNADQDIPNKVNIHLNHDPNMAGEGTLNFGNSARIPIPGQGRLDNIENADLKDPSDEEPLTEDNQNFVGFTSLGQVDESVDIYILKVPSETAPERISVKGLEKRALILKLKMWR